jgi:hypothetical protein
MWRMSGVEVVIFIGVSASRKDRVVNTVRL